eukprot:s3524_g7.t1
MSQWKALNAKIDKGANGSTTTSAALLLQAASQASNEESLNQLNALESRLSSATTKADSNHQSLQEKVEALQQELQQISRTARGHL